MKILAITSQKGGVGKTTIATALAVAAGEAGKAAALFDLDPQASACFWADQRAKTKGHSDNPNPIVRDISPARLAHYLDRLRDAGADLVILDCPPVHKDIAHDASAAADLVLIPTKPEIFDIRSMQQTVRAVRDIGKQAAVVLTFCPHSGPEIEQATEIVKGLGVPLAPAALYQRKAYGRAQEHGLAPQEFEPDSKAADEIRQLYMFACSQLFGEKQNGKARPQSRIRA